MMILTYQDKQPQLKYRRELRAQDILKVFSLDVCHLAIWKIKHLFREQLQDCHVVLAEALVRLAGSDDVRDERRPVFRPFSFQNENKEHVQLAEANLLSLGTVAFGRGLDDEANDVILNSFALLPWKGFPSRFDDRFQDCKCIESCFLIVWKLENGVNPCPSLWILHQSCEHISCQSLLWIKEKSINN